MKLQTSGVLGTSYAIAKLAPKREYLKNLNDPDILQQISGFGNEVRTLSQHGYTYNTTSKMFIK